ncbi:MAG: hypothetical protein ABW021_03765, partial [Acidimicrobiia bacterium]
MTAGEYSSNQGSRDRLRGTHGAPPVDLLQTSERVVRHIEPGRLGPQEFTHQVEKFEHLGRRRPRRLVHHPGKVSFDLVRLH